MHLWCGILPLATTTLNLMRPSRMNPKLPAEATLNGAFDYNKTPLAPPSTKILVHETTNQRRTWAAYGVDGWYLGAAPERYRCHRTYITETRKELIARTFGFPPNTTICRPRCPLTRQSWQLRIWCTRSRTSSLQLPMPQFVQNRPMHS